MAQGNQQSESPWMLVGAALAILLGMVFLLWTGNELQIVHGGTILYHYMGALWNWAPLDLVRDYNTRLETEYAAFYAAGSKTTFVQWMRLSSEAYRPYSILLFFPAFLVVGLVSFGPRVDFKRRFKGDDLMLEIMKTFSGVAPVAKLNLVNSTEPKWRSPMWPEEIVKEERLARDNAVVPERARRYYLKTLGPRIVDLQAIKGRDPKSVCFADSMTPAGKAIYTILTAFAFGGEAGRQEARELIDTLNYSAFGTPHGTANLALATSLFQKYRMQPEAHALFRVHHYENTYLFELFRRAKRWGKVNTSHFRWLRPMDRYKFFALDCVRRFVPHPEAAAAFNLHAFERDCYRQGRIPKGPDPSGNPLDPGAPYIEDAIESLRLEFEGWLGRRDPDGEDRIWNNPDLWKIHNPAYNVEAGEVPGAAPPPDTAFDTTMKAQEVAAENRRDQQFKSELAQALDEGRQ
ncbi:MULTISPECIES: hypothetical protein [unclassified Burkholderia]|uniref:secretion/conjugation apparatus DotM-related subunit n=1 Tax=unclassified Burkholderia TaxID=2613784 RepID=UPI002AAF18F6|nr:MULTISPECIES: hypothetical protein [unclassified Burkholderia]